jgi:hypothetical protein
MNSGSLDPQVLLLRDKISSLEQLMKQQTVAQATVSINELLAQMELLKNTFIDDMSAIKDGGNETLKQFSDNLEVKLKDIDTKLAANQKKLKEDTEKFATNAAAIYGLSAKNLEKFQELMTKKVKATGDDIKKADDELQAFVRTNLANIGSNFDEYKERYSETLKSIISSTPEAWKNLDQFGEEVKKALLQIKPGMASAKDLEEALKSLNITEDMVRQNQAKFGESLINTTTAINNQGKAIDYLIDQQTKLKEAGDKVKENGEAQEAGFNDMTAAFRRYADVLGNEQPTLLGGILKSTLSIAREKNTLSDFFSSVGKGIGSVAADMFSYEKMIDRTIGFVVKRVYESTFEMAKAFARLNETTGGFGLEAKSASMSKSFLGLSGFNGAQLAMYGVTLEKFGEAYGSLANTIGGFNDMMDEQRLILAANASALKSLGVNAETYGKITANLMGTAGKSALDSRDAIEGLARDAIALGKNVGQYLNEFSSGLSKISGYGREATQIFKELNGLVQATKGVLTTGDLVSFADQFNTFDTAAESVSKLNAMLGGTSINILEMMKADPTEKLMMIKRAANDANLEFDKLNVGYKRLLAESFGGDMQKAAAFYKMDMSEALDYMERAQASEEELEKRKRASITAQERLNTALDSMKVMFTPILDFFNLIAKGILKLEKGIGVLPTVGLVFTGMLVAATVAWNSFKVSAVQAVNQIAVAFGMANGNINVANGGVARFLAELRAASSQTAILNKELTMTSGLTKTVGLNAGAGKFAGLGGAGKIAGIALGVGMLASMANTATESSTAYDHMEAGVIGPDGKVHNTSNNFIYKDGKITTFSPLDSVGAAKPGERAVLEPGSKESIFSSVSNFTTEKTTNASKYGSGPQLTPNFGFGNLFSSLETGIKSIGTNINSGMSDGMKKLAPTLAMKEDISILNAEKNIKSENFISKEIDRALTVEGTKLESKFEKESSIKSERNTGQELQRLSQEIQRTNTQKETEKQSTFAQTISDKMSETIINNKTEQQPLAVNATFQMDGKQFAQHVVTKHGDILAEDTARRWLTNGMG